MLLPAGLPKVDSHHLVCCQDMLFRAMRSETAVRVVEAYTRRHREVCYMKMLTRMQERQLNQHNIENACAPLKVPRSTLSALAASLYTGTSKGPKG